MNERAVEDLIASSEALIAALDAHDIDAIETALPAFGRSVEALGAPGDWTTSPGVRARLEEAMRLADGARARVRYLADRTQQRIDMLAVAAGRFDCTPATYGRPGR
ncbi:MULTISPECIES: hypothetical protein [unclassified Sphingomonas]|uniref:hypothetical protein n=1 Tax=unclassified Sphingomonas TaxID=196159 RepID=UPI0006F32CC1|nr:MULTISPECIES: hypothetical protein [unclassified Sphingomonas]KQX26121.1 hypothetical protein ASD17_01260 [Sphingomonas sp. Root1294]KQY69188.1 hypothetical protein ASD39_02455 [Sphingomonas sp. Root50]KRB89443.1 hypothetical protein ASE22_17370 [Sphingomonas sp. Root720]